MQTACSFSFNIAAWNAVSSRVASAEQWQQWAAGRLDAESLPEYKPRSEDDLPWVLGKLDVLLDDAFTIGLVVRLLSKSNGDPLMFEIQ